jgi:hypothetical protein
MRYHLYLTVRANGNLDRWISFSNYIESNYVLQVGMKYLIPLVMRCEIIEVTYSESDKEEGEHLAVEMTHDWEIDDFEFESLRKEMDDSGWGFIEGRWGDEFIC